MEVSPISFNGLWGPVRTMEKETGVFYRGKTYYKLKEKIYYPWKGETPEEIAAATDKYFKGRSFSVMDISIEDSQNKYSAYHMNFIKIGEPIEKSEAPRLIEQGYSEDFADGILNDTDFYATYSNASYAPFDIHEMSKESVKDFAQRHFNLTV